MYTCSVCHSRMNLEGRTSSGEDIMSCTNPDCVMHRITNTADGLKHTSLTDARKMQNVRRETLSHPNPWHKHDEEAKRKEEERNRRYGNKQFGG